MSGYAVIAGTNHDGIVIWNLGRGIPSSRLVDFGPGAYAVAVSRDGNVVAAACADAKLHFWNATTAVKLASIDTQINSGTCVGVHDRREEPAQPASVDFTDGENCIRASESLRFWMRRSLPLGGGLCEAHGTASVAAICC